MENPTAFRTGMTGRTITVEGVGPDRAVVERLDGRLVVTETFGSGPVDADEYDIRVRFRRALVKMESLGTEVLNVFRAVMEAIVTHLENAAEGAGPLFPDELLVDVMRSLVRGDTGPAIVALGVRGFEVAL